MGERLVDEEEKQRRAKAPNSIPPVGGTAGEPPNSARAPARPAAAATRPPPYPLPRSRLAPHVWPQQPTTAPGMPVGEGSGRRLCRRACGVVASLALVAAGILLCLAPLFLHNSGSGSSGGGGGGALLGCLGLLLVVLGLVGLFLACLAMGNRSSSGSPAIVIPAPAVKQPLLGGRLGSGRQGPGRPGNNLTVVVE